MSKVRRIDWSPDEWIAGVDGVLTMREAAIYQRVLMAIYSRNGECPNDAEFIAGRFAPEGDAKHRQARAALTAQTRRALDRLIELGKLHVTTDGQGLTNGRADAELNKARERISGTVRAGIASGRARRAHPKPTTSQPRANPEPMGSILSNYNGLARTRVRNHQPPLRSDTDRDNSTDAARALSPELEAAQARAPTGPDPFDGERKAPPHSPKMSERLAEAAARARAKFLKGET